MHATQTTYMQSAISKELSDFNLALRKKEVPILLTPRQLRAINKALADIHAQPCQHKHLRGMYATIKGVAYTHGVIVDRNQLPVPPADTHIRIDLIRKNLINTKRRDKTTQEFHPVQYTTSNSIGRIRLVLTKYGFHELHVNLDKEEHGKGYGILLYMLAVLQYIRLGLTIKSSTHPSIQAHAVYYSSRFRQAVTVNREPTRYDIVPKTDFIELVHNAAPELDIWNCEVEFNYKAALKPHETAVERMYALQQQMSESEGGYITSHIDDHTDQEQESPDKNFAARFLTDEVFFKLL